MATITIHQAQQISALKRQEGRAKLAESLGWEPFDEEDDLQKGILLDYLYDSLMYTVDKGVSWPHVCILFKLTKEMQEEGIGKSIVDCIKLFSSKCSEIAGSVSELSLKKYTEYFFASYMTHHKLYQYVFSTRQEEKRKQVEVNVETPGNPLPFKDAQEVAVYEYEKKINEIEEAEAQKKDERIKEKREAAQEVETVMSKAHDQVGGMEPPLTREKLVDLIHEVASAHLTAASNAIKINIEETLEDLQFMLAKTALPRPQVMASGPFIPIPHTPRSEDKPPAQAASKEDVHDQVPPMQAFGKQSPPPRYKTKTPIAAKRPTSKNPDSREKQSTVPPSRN